jgi:hypothetical protein
MGHKFVKVSRCPRHGRRTTNRTRAIWCSTSSGRATTIPRTKHGSPKQTCMSHATRACRRRRADSRREGAIDVMNEYFDDIGGRPEPTRGAQKRKGRTSGLMKSEAGTPASSAKRVKQEQTWSPPQGSWEHDVDYIDTVEERVDPKTGELAKFAYLVWNNDKKTQHPLKHVYLKCPQKACGV